MEYVNEPAERVEAQLRERGATVRREPYVPRGRSLLSDFVGFLRTPDAGSTVTLYEDDEGLVRYYTVARPDAEVAGLRTQVDRLSETASALEQRVLPALEQKVAKLPQLEAKLEELSGLERKVGQLDNLRVRVERLERPG